MGAETNEPESGRETWVQGGVDGCSAGLVCFREEKIVMGELVKDGPKGINGCNCVHFCSELVKIRC